MGTENVVYGRAMRFADWLAAHESSQGCHPCPPLQLPDGAGVRSLDKTRELAEVEVTAFLNHLGESRVAAATQNQALSALLFLYKEVLGKGGKDRITILPAAVIEPLKAHLDRVKLLHEHDVAAGYGDVELPNRPRVRPASRSM